MSKYTKLLQVGLLPEFITCEQAEIITDCICHDCYISAIDNHIVKSKINDNGVISINTVSLLEFADQEDKKYYNKCQNERIVYLMGLEENETE